LTENLASVYAAGTPARGREHGQPATRAGATAGQKGRMAE